MSGNVAQIITTAGRSPRGGFTEEGGLAVRATNKTGANSVKGTLICPSAGTDNAFDLVAVDGPNIVAIVYDEGIADGSECWVVVFGIAEVKFAGATTRGHMARMTVAGDVGDAPGIAISEAYPTPPFATDKHFQEIGHVLESIGGAGLAKCILHFN